MRVSELVGEAVSDRGDGCGEKLLGLGSIWKVEPKGFPNGFDVSGGKHQGRGQGFGLRDEVP